MASLALPPPLTPFVGRQKELADISALLADPTCRLLTLVGPGGIGKTRLALEAAAQVSAYADGIYFVPLQPLTSPDLILSAIAEAVRFQFYPGSEPRQQLLDYLRPKTLLLIMDNFEHLLDGVGLITKVLSYAPGVKVLATSRETLNLHEEWLYPVQGMAVPDDEHAQDVEHYAAVQLFTQSARRVQPNFSLHDERVWVIRACQLIEGMPLAIELAAAWLKSVPCHEIVREIERSLDILQTSARNIPPRHRSMRAAFEPSWTLLSDDERAAFSKLSVFRGGFTKEAAQAIAGTSLFVLSSLVDKSLLQIDSNGRYDLHELLRQYAAEKLDETPEVARRARDLHSRYYANFLFERQEELLHGNPKPMLIEIRQELENVRLAWNWMVVQVYADQIETTIVSLAMYYAHAGLYTEGEENFGLAADQLRERGGVALARALDFQGWCAYFLNHYEESKALYLESLPIYRESGVTDGIINCLLRLSDIARWSGNYAEARRLAEEGVREIEERGQDKRWMLTFLFGNLGEIAFLTGDYSEAQQYHEKSLAVAQEFGTQIGIADALNNLGKVHLAIKAYDEARRAYQRGLKRGKELDYERGVIVALSGLGEIALRTRALDEAKQHFQEALQLIAQRTIPRNLTLDALVRIAELLIEEEYFEPAIEILILCFRYPASQESTKQQAQLLLEQLQSRVPRDTFQRSFERTSPSRLDEVIVSLLNSAPFGRPAPQWLPPQDLLIGAPLTERELEILRLLAEGMSNSDIAQHLVLALSTVKWYLNIIYSKLEVANRTQAVARARQLHLLP